MNAERILDAIVAFAARPLPLAALALVATLAYGLGNWYLVQGDKAQARTWFERSIQSGGWPGFGFIVSEVELRRLR